jgi:hypothetical protein
VKAIDLCVARFDDDTKESFLNLYSKIDAGVDVSAPAVENEVEQDEVVDEE